MPPKDVITIRLIPIRLRSVVFSITAFNPQSAHSAVTYRIYLELYKAPKHFNLLTNQWGKVCNSGPTKKPKRGKKTTLLSNTCPDWLMIFRTARNLQYEKPKNWIWKLVGAHVLRKQNSGEITPYFKEVFVMLRSKCLLYLFCPAIKVTFCSPHSKDLYNPLTRRTR